MKRKYRFYSKQSLNLNNSFILEKELVHRLIHVMRFKRNDKFYLFNGDGFEYQACLINSKTGEILIDEKKYCFAKSTCSICLVISIVKGKKIDEIIQKSVELGVSEIQPILSQNCETFKIIQQQKYDHWKKISIQASEQCGRNDLITIHPVQKLLNYLVQYNQNQQSIVFSPASKKSIQSIQLKTQKKLHLFIGPEGGWTEHEKHQFNQLNFSFANLGDRILRTETAAMAAITLAQHHFARMINYSALKDHKAELGDQQDGEKWSPLGHQNSVSDDYCHLVDLSIL